MGAFLDGPAHSKCLEIAKNVGGRNVRFWPKSRIWNSRSLLKTMSDHDQLHPADQPELHLRHHRLQLQQGEHRGGGTGPCTHCRGGAESVLTLSSTVIGVGLHRLGLKSIEVKLKSNEAKPSWISPWPKLTSLELQEVIHHRLQSSPSRPWWSPTRRSNIKCAKYGFCV